MRCKPRAHGCSLKIHRVESALLTETVRTERSGADRAVSNILIASKQNSILKREFQVELNTANASGERPDRHSLGICDGEGSERSARAELEEPSKL